MKILPHLFAVLIACLVSVASFAARWSTTTQFDTFENCQEFLSTWGGGRVYFYCTRAFGDHQKRPIAGAYDPVSNKFIKIPKIYPAGFAIANFWVKGRYVVFVGSGSGVSRQFFPVVYDPVKNKWHGAERPMAPIPFSLDDTFVALDDGILIWTPEGFQKFDPVSFKWTNVAPDPFNVGKERPQHLRTALLGKHVYFWRDPSGDYKSIEKGEAFVLHLETNTWDKVNLKGLPDALAAKRSTFLAAGGKLFLWGLHIPTAEDRKIAEKECYNFSLHGGGCKSISRSGDLGFLYDPKKQEWLPINPNNVPKDRYLVVASENLVYVFGKSPSALNVTTNEWLKLPPLPSDLSMVGTDDRDFGGAVKTQKAVSVWAAAGMNRVPPRYRLAGAIYSP